MLLRKPLVPISPLVFLIGEEDPFCLNTEPAVPTRTIPPKPVKSGKQQGDK